MQILQDAGRIALARALAAQTAFIAWGRGDGAWTAAPATPSNRTALLDEIGRRQAVVGYVTPATSEDYDVELPGAVFYKVSTEPTPYLHVRATFGFGDAVGETVRESGVFFGTVPGAGVPPGQRYLLPADVATPGDLYSLELRPPSARSGTTKSVEEVVIPL